MPSDHDKPKRWQFRLSDLLYVMTGVAGGIAITQMLHAPMVIYYDDISFTVSVFATILFWIGLAKASGRNAVSCSTLGLLVVAAFVLGIAQRM